MVCNMHNCNRYFFGLFFLYLFPFGLVDRCLFWECMNKTILSHLTLFFLEVFAVWGGANNPTLDHDDHFFFCSCFTEDDLLFQIDFSLSFWCIVFLPNCVF